MTALVDNRAVVIVSVFAGAWLLSRASAWVARRVLIWHEHREVGDPEATSTLVDVKRRETLVALIRTGIAYAGLGAALVLTVAELIG
ncbi:MAG: hypothetical protein ACXVEM_08900, partial [Gaiellaceae bacterium]